MPESDEMTSKNIYGEMKADLDDLDVSNQPTRSQVIRQLKAEK
ncbi:hypothetical protein Ocin01_19422 [Orchesella cincta]|uniref:Uncharacterized protein n=1 Tax=Orchesella cincta TaxID=48709 RepID=A0A1D2M2R7_ORCCI|nr:hypothetical protein Ocin01_19422 [Orchesella cincta]